MFGLFESKSKYRNVSQFVSMTWMTWVLYEFFTNPEAQYSTHGMELVTLAFSLYASASEEVLLDFVSMLITSFRMGSAFSEVTHDVGGFSDLFNSIGLAAIHPASIVEKLMKP